MPWTHAYILLILFSPPPCRAADLQRFPGPECVFFALQANEAHQKWLECHGALEPRYSLYWRERVGENERAEEAWRSLRYAHNNAACVGQGWANWSEADVICHLAEVRELIGEAAYASGQMPPPVPLWRFRLRE